MALSVVIRSGDLKAPATITFDAPRIVIGRGEGCEVRLPDPSVSHRHASIRQRGTDYVIVDEGSTNGTFAGPVRLSPQAPRVIRSGDLVRVGRIWLELKVEQAPPTPNLQASTREIALSLVASALAAEGGAAHARVTVESGPDQGKELELSEFERVYVLGRAPGLDLSLADADASRRHVEVFRRGQHVCVRDLGSKNGSELGSQRLEPNRETPWSSASLLRFGANTFALSDPVLETLGELEAAVDEQLRPDDPIEPPESSASDASGGAGGEGESSAARRGAAPIAEVPFAERRAASSTTPGSGLRAADAAIALFAIVVLALSGIGLFWLLR
jgi:pSer/pThr/pTyr-binding forkhead associated (FHA) protein